MKMPELMIDSVEGLREVYRPPAQRSLDKEIDHLDERCRDFIAHAPFVILASTDGDGRIDAARVALWSWNVDSNRFTMDQRAFELWGLPWAGEVAFEELSTHIHPSDRDRVRSAFSATRSVARLWVIP